MIAKSLSDKRGGCSGFAIKISPLLAVQIALDVLFPSRWQNRDTSVVSSESVNSRFDENQSEL